MKNIEKEITKMKNLYKYKGNITLLESIKLNESLINDVDVNENAILKNLFKGTKLKNVQTLTHGGLSSVNKTLADDLLNIFNNRGQLKTSGIATIDDLIGGLAKGTLNSKQLGDVLVGTMKSPGVSSQLVRELTPIWVNDANFIKSHIKDGQFVTKRKDLLRKGYTDEAIDAIELHFKTQKAGQKIILKNNKGGNTQLNPKGNGGNVPPKQKQTLKEKFNELIGGVKNKKWTWKQTLAWGIPLGIGAVALWWFFVENNETVPDGIPENEPTDTQWAPCISKLVQNKQGNIVTLTDNSIVVKVTTEEYPSGVYFYDNGNVYDVGKKVWGKWKCKDGKVIAENTLIEQIDTSMSSDVDKMIDLLDFPVTQSDLKDAYTLLKKYSDSGKGKKFLELYQQSGLGGGDLNKTLKYLYTRRAESVQYKNEIKNLISQIESGSDGSSSPSTGNPLDGIELIWGGDKKDDGKKDDGDGKKKPLYIDCTDFPFKVSCKNAAIKEVQKCLGMPINLQTGNFGPITLKNLKAKRGESIITKEVYDEIMKNCKQGNTETDTITTDTPTSTETPTDTQTTPTNTETPVPPKPNTETPPNVVTIDSETQSEILRNIKKQGILNRYVYKGRDLTPDEQKYLIDYMRERGYGKFIPKEKMGPNDKYVFGLLKK